MRGWHGESYRHSLAARGIKTRWPTEEQFIEHHRTGFILSDVYDKYSTSEGIAWLGGSEGYPQLLKTLKIDGENIEIRIKLDENRYVKTDANENIVRDERGMAVYLTDVEVKEKGYSEYNPVIVAFNESGNPIGFASNEWGASGVWVITEYQKKGIGFELLKVLRNYFKEEQRMGQMTEAGEHLTRSYYRRLSKEESL